jgi:4-aminobutyrate aminotransferase
LAAAVTAPVKTQDITGHETRPRVTAPIPGPEGRRIIERDEAYVATTTKTAPVVARRARGTVVEGVDGNVYLDFCSGIGVLNTGHSHPRVVAAVQRQAAELVHFAGTDFYYAIQADLAKRLAKAVPGSDARKVFFTNSGTEANEAAIKVVRWATKRPQLIAFQRAFHGRTLGALSLTSSKIVQRGRFFPTMPGVHTIPFPDPYRNVFGIDGYDEPERLVDAVIGTLETLFETALPPDEAGALFAEPVQGEGGYVFPPKTFFPRLKRLLDQHGILLAADEIQTGFGRTGRLFAMEHYGVVPEVVTIAKAMGSGYPIGACVFDADLDFGVKGAHSSTFGGNLVSCAAAMATLDVFEQEDLVARAERTGQHLAKRLDELKQAHPAIGDARGLGLMRAIDFVKDPATREPDTDLRDRVLGAAIQKGLIVLPAGPSAIRIIPPLVVTHEQVDAAVEVLDDAIKEASA